MKKLSFDSPEAFQTWIAAFTADLTGKDIILLDGPMGAGKTFFVKALAQIMGIGEANSPTFALHHRYEVGAKAMDHVDLYRLENDADLESSGFWDLFRQDKGLICIEWAGKLPQTAYPKNWRIHSIQIETAADPKKRVITYA